MNNAFDKHRKTVNRIQKKQTRMLKASIKIFFELANSVMTHPDCTNDIKKIIAEKALDLQSKIKA